MTEIKLYNTRTRRKEVFRPIDPANVRMYVCGPTVYDRAHIGNARPVVVFDVLYRLLRHVYGAKHVTYVRNFTDVDDRIIDRAVATKGADETLEEATRRITDETIGWYHQDMDALGALRPDHEPRCTAYIGEMVTMIEGLIARGHAYESQKHVLFAVESYDSYGRLSGRSVDDMIAGARVEVAPYKKNPMDFVLWKPSTDEQPGWSSPWGRGRPGWHIECSAMARALLGEVFDIHAGGIDLQFPHHENELAQSCCAHDTDVMANWWLHNEMLRVEGEKMSKSLGNFFTVRDLLDQGIPGEVVRFVLLSTHYRQNLDWTAKRVEEARRIIGRWRRALDVAHKSYLQHEAYGEVQSRAVLSSLIDDLNTWNAIRGIDVMAKRLIDASNDSQIQRDAGLKFLNGLGLLGFETMESQSFMDTIAYQTVSETFRERIEALLKERLAARKAKDFARADEIRDGLVAAGIVVEDAPDGSTWKRTDAFDPDKLEALK